MKNGIIKRMICTAVSVILGGALLLSGCVQKPKDNGKVPEPTAGDGLVVYVLSDNTLVYDYYVQYFTSLKEKEPEVSARRFAARLSLCKSTGLTLSDRDIEAADKKAEELLDFYKLSKDEAYDEACAREFAITLQQYKSIMRGYYLIDMLYDTLSVRFAATEQEALDYLERQGIAGGIYLLRSEFDGKTYPVLPEGVAIEGYPDESIGYKELLEMIGESLKDSDDMSALIDANRSGTDQDIVTLSELADSYGSLSNSIKEEVLKYIKAKGDTCVIMDGQNYILLYCFDYDEAVANDDIEAVRSSLTSQRVEKEIEDYVDSLLG